MKHLKYYKPFLLEAQEAQSATQSQVVEEPNLSDEVIEETPKEDIEIKSEKIIG